MTAFAIATRMNPGIGPGKALLGVARCPHCGVANPNLVQIFSRGVAQPRLDGGPAYNWSVYACERCGSFVVMKSILNKDQYLAVDLYPAPKSAHEDIPQLARRFLQQAIDTLHAPDAAAVMAGSAVDAMLKELGYKEGSLYARIDLALKDNVLTNSMADWAHEVRLGSNRPRHADADRPHVTPDEAQQSVEFAEALGQFLFVLTARIQRGIAAAKQSTSQEPSQT